MATWIFASVKSPGPGLLWSMKTSAATVVFAEVATPMGSYCWENWPHPGLPVRPGPVNFASIRVFHSLTFTVLSVGVQVIRTARRRPGVVGTLIEAFGRSCMGASSTASRFMPWEYNEKPASPTLSVKGLLAGNTVGPLGPCAVPSGGLVPVQPTRASNPIAAVALAPGRIRRMSWNDASHRIDIDEIFAPFSHFGFHASLVQMHTPRPPAGAGSGSHNANDDRTHRSQPRCPYDDPSPNKGTH